MCTAQVWVCDCLWPGPCLHVGFSWPLLSKSPGGKYHHVSSCNPWPSHQAHQSWRWSLAAFEAFERLHDQSKILLHQFTSVRFQVSQRVVSFDSVAYVSQVRTGLGPLRNARCPTVAVAVAVTCLQDVVSVQPGATENAINSPQIFS